MESDNIIGKKALIRSSAHSSRYGYVGTVVVFGTVLAVDDAIHVHLEEGRFSGKTWQVPLAEASVEPAGSQPYSLDGDGAWEEETGRVAAPDIVIEWQQWQPE